MGFYDEPDVQNPPPKKQFSPSTIWVPLVSAIIGGLVALFLAPFLMEKGIIPEPSKQQEPLFGDSKTASYRVNSEVTEAVNKVGPAVVSVINLKTSGDFFSTEQVQQGTGSGIIFKKANGKALIVTNNHVIEGGSSFKVNISSEDGEHHEVDAKLLGSDQYTDLAVLEIDDKYVTKVAEFGNSDSLKAGEPAIAIGNPLGLGRSITVGVISSPKRTIEVSSNMATDVIQTDAAINPGNSGGALVNVAGQVIGINTLKISDQGVEGLGFAIPVNEARPVIESLVKDGKVQRPYLGLSLIDLSNLPVYVLEELRLPGSVREGVAVAEVVSGSPADQAGLQPRDVIIALDGQEISSSSELRKYLYTKKEIHQKVDVTYYRNGEKQTTSIVLGEAPKSFQS
ncbi:trypsin-like peptidase domain-containing protein [Thermoactinomyces intermedius]|jgi:serine protease Do|uniref:Trypsin-like peptidase domain-containing protein n=1 Tax=Thermoactinomyces intermedius TaxID=2024 RepID=A0A8I1ACM7_THEIN|nr:trypsin-like peptidase domain-containing protein [Thermoactinomyces intermedius]MBA4548065.1 trypsin-like peptidase domain-containing protein [Thermoactinomyces intermedius]MBA4835706.1 trypsin-like peptidase domain-containing protein [Thermoactinomyces intermedius]MBH8594909.1 trypsin-like peptidase domain-containing protein [Thermoactinomyces intermedius]